MSITYLSVSLITQIHGATYVVLTTASTTVKINDNSKQTVPNYQAPYRKTGNFQFIVHFTSKSFVTRVWDDWNLV